LEYNTIHSLLHKRYFTNDKWLAFLFIFTKEELDYTV
jgi:hypothetical protein